MLKRLVSGTTETFSKGLVYIREEERKNEAEKQSESKQHKLSQIGKKQKCTDSRNSVNLI